MSAKDEIADAALRWARQKYKVNQWEPTVNSEDELDLLIEVECDLEGDLYELCLPIIEDEVRV